MFQESEMVTVLKEIRKNDPNFEKEKFIDYAQGTLIPMLLESYLSGDVKSLEDWCSEPVRRAHSHKTPCIAVLSSLL